MERDRDREKKDRQTDREKDRQTYIDGETHREGLGLNQGKIYGILIVLDLIDIDYIMLRISSVGYTVIVCVHNLRVSLMTTNTGEHSYS